jgi:hypothetical protein
MFRVFTSSLCLRVVLENLFNSMVRLPGSRLFELYDHVEKKLTYPIFSTDTVYMEWWAGTIDETLGFMGWCKLILKTPKTIQLRVECYEMDSIGYHPNRTEWYTPRGLEYLLYAVEGFEKREVVLALMSPSSGHEATDEFEWMFYVDFAGSLAGQLEFDLPDQYMCSYWGVFRL